MFAQLHIRVNPRIHSHSEVFGNYPQCSATPAMFWSTQYFTDVFLSLGTRSRGTCSKIWQFNIEYSSSSRNLARWVHSDSCAATTLLESLSYSRNVLFLLATKDTTCRIHIHIQLLSGVCRVSSNFFFNATAGTWTLDTVWLICVSTLILSPRSYERLLLDKLASL